MRRSLVLAATLVLLLVLAPSTRAEDEGPQKAGMTPERVARMILLGGDAQQTFVAQYLQSADRDTLLSIQRAVRTLAPKVAEEMKAEQARRTPSPPAQGPATIVTIETRVLEVTSEGDLFGDLGLRPARGTSFVLLDEAQKQVILRAVEKSERVKQLTAPRITVYDGQRANVSVLNQVSYIKDYDIEMAGNEEWVADPVVGIVQEGLMIDIRPVVSADRKSVTIDIDATWADLERPMRERKLMLKEGAEPVTIQLPSIDVGAAHATATLPTGGSALVASPGTFGTANERVIRYVLVTAEVATIEAADLRKDVPNPNERRGK